MLRCAPHASAAGRDQAATLLKNGTRTGGTPQQRTDLDVPFLTENRARQIWGLNFQTAIPLAIDVVSEFYPEYGRWALLFDELEIAPPAS